VWINPRGDSRLDRHNDDDAQRRTRARLHYYRRRLAPARPGAHARRTRPASSRRDANAHRVGCRRPEGAIRGQRRWLRPHEGGGTNLASRRSVSTTRRRGSVRPGHRSSSNRARHERAITPHLGVITLDVVLLTSLDVAFMRLVVGRRVDGAPVAPERARCAARKSWSPDNERCAAFSSR
jgi:hypothetical protein